MRKIFNNKKVNIVYIVFISLILFYLFLFWFGFSKDALGYAIVVEWALSFITLIVCSILVGTFKDKLTWLDFFIPLFFSLFLSFYEWCTYPLANMIACGPKFNWPSLDYFLSALIASYVSFLLAVFIHQAILKKFE